MKTTENTPKWQVYLEGGIDLNVHDLVDASGIKEHSDFDELDYAVPMNPDYSYPFNGRAVSVYWKGETAKAGNYCEIIPYSRLARKAIARWLAKDKVYQGLAQIEQINQDLQTTEKE